MIQSPYEYNLGRYIYGGQTEKTFIDKTLARSDIEEIKDIMQKEDLKRKDLLKLLYLLSGTEIKLVNFDEFDRYLLGKFYAWIRDFVASAETLYDIQEDIAKKKITVNANTIKMLENVRVKLVHSVKFLVDVFFYLSRSTLSLEASGFDTITKTRYEYYYPEGMGQIQNQDTQKRGLFNLSLRGR